MSGGEGEDELTLSLVFKALRERWKLVLLCTLGAGIILTLISFVLPETFVATSTLLPATSGSQLSSLSKIAAGLVDLDLQPRSLDDAVTAYPVMVRSRRFATELLGMRFPRAQGRDSVRLIDMLRPGRSGPKRLEMAVRTLRKDIGADVDRRTGVLNISVTLPDPVAAAAVANAVDSLLQGFLLQTTAERASQQRQFLEERLSDTKARLGTAEDALRDFRERNVRIDRSPRLQLEEGRLLRSVREQEEIYLTLQREHEMARIAEHKDVPTLSVVDPPFVPVSHHWPPRRLFALGGLALGFALGGSLAVQRYGRLRGGTSSV